MGGVGAVFGFGDAEREEFGAFGQVVHPLGPLRLGSVFEHQQQADVVGDDGVLVLQIAVQTEAAASQVLADHGHTEVGAVTTAVLGGEGVAVVAGGIGASAGFGEQFLPVPAREPAAFPVGAGVFPAVVEEADIVVGLFERDDLLLDEIVQFVQIGDQIGGQFEIHGDSYAFALGRICMSRSHSISETRRPPAAMTISRTVLHGRLPRWIPHPLDHVGQAARTRLIPA